MGTDDPPSENDLSAARFRAAFAYANYKPKDIAAALGMSTRTVGRLQAGEGAYTHELWQRVVTLTRVPAWFIESGFDGARLPDEAQLAERTEALENQMRTVLDVLSIRVTAAAAGSVERPPGAHEDPAGEAGQDHPE